jgi:peroxiredoxin
VELRRTLEPMDDLVILYVMADNQINAKTLRFVDELGLHRQVRFLRDDGSAAIDQLGLRKEDTEPIEEGVPHPATYVLDRNGIVRFADVRTDYHVWLEPDLLVDALASIP